MDLQVLGVAVVAAWAIMKFIDAVIKPLWERAGLEDFWLLYVALAIGAPLAWFTGLNAFPVFVEAPVIGRVLTCLAVGLGPSFIYDISKKPEWGA